MKTMILAAVLAVALMLAGCGGGSKGGAGAGMPSTQTPTTPRPTVRVVPLSVPGEPETPAGAVEIPDNTVRITPGQTREVSVGGRSVSVRCPSGGASCHVGVHEGGLWYRLDGAVPFALASLPSTPTPTTPPTRVIEPPLVSRGELPSWGELPALVDRMNHRAELGSSCDDGVAACQAVVKDLLANVGRKSAYDEISVDETRGTFLYDQVDETRGTFRTLQVDETLGRFYFTTVYRQSQDEYRNLASHWGGWLENSIFIHTYDSGSGHTEDLERVISMGIRDTNPVTGVYRGPAFDRNTTTSGNFELTYTSGATGGQLDFTVNGLHTSYRDEPSTYTWTNVSVDNEGYFDNGITPNRQGLGAHKLEGSFYQGGEVGGVFSYRKPTGSDPVYHGVFGGKLVPDTP